MGGRVGLAVLEIGGMQLRGAGIVIIEPLFPQRFEIGEVSGVLLDRPLALRLSGEDIGPMEA